MRRPLLRSSAFIKTTKNIVKKNPEIIEILKATLQTLEENAFDPKLKTHKLKGQMERSYACSINYSLRIIFKLVDFEDKECILLESVGSHDEVY
jgi:addiction module RelE/StbE family toxin